MRSRDFAADRDHGGPISDPLSAVIKPEAVSFQL